MVVFHRTATIKNGKVFEAIARGKAVAAYLSEHYAGYSVQFFVERYGDPFRVHWLGQAEDVATVDAMLSNLMSDAGYIAAARPGGSDDTPFEAGSIRDTLLVSP